MVVDQTAADRNALGQSDVWRAESLDQAEIVELDRVVDVDPVTVLIALRRTGDRPVVGDRGEQRSRGRLVIDIDAGTALAGDRTVIDDRRQSLAGDAMASAGDGAAGEVVQRRAGIDVEIDPVARVVGIAQRDGDDLSVVVDDGIGAGADGVVVSRLDQPSGAVGDNNGGRAGDGVEIYALS